MRDLISSRPVGNAIFISMRLKRLFASVGLTVRPKTSNTVTKQRFAKRGKNSNWTELNKERCGRLEKLGLMTDSGRAVLPDMSEAGLVINQDILMLLQSDNMIWQIFLSFTALYQRVRIDTIQFNKHRSVFFSLA